MGGCNDLVPQMAKHGGDSNKNTWSQFKIEFREKSGDDKGLGYQLITLKNVWGNNYLSVCSGCIPDINIGKLTSDPEKSYAQWWAAVVVHENGKKYLSFMNEFGPLAYQTGKLCDELGDLVRWILVDVLMRFVRVRAREWMGLKGTDGHGSAVVVVVPLLSTADKADTADTRSRASKNFFEENNGLRMIDEIQIVDGTNAGLGGILAIIGRDMEGREESATCSGWLVLVALIESISDLGI
ncbi:MAG: hypothetical protein J3Q66DRAFT_423980 [Benniella sp.]|nr:MAG: hypothetical protein J3Q66DRAFT_423980 [Benniella sp.]